MAHYAILRVQKLKSAVAVHRSMKHAFRDQDTPNADAKRTPENTHIGAESVSEGMAAFRARLPEKHRKDAVLAIEYLITGSPEAMQGKQRGSQDAYFRDALQWLKEKHGAENVVYAGIHRDESTPHMYAYVVPRVGEKLNCRHFLGGSRALNEMQTDFAQSVGVKHGLQRGIEGSRAKHERVQRHYGLVNRAANQAQELGMLDKASLAFGKPTKRAAEALEAAGATVALAHEFKARQKAIKQREIDVFKTEMGLRNEKVRNESREIQVGQAMKQFAELRRELDAAKKLAVRSDKLAKLYQQGRDEAIDELRALRPQRGRDLER